MITQEAMDYILQREIEILHQIKELRLIILGMLDEENEQ